jgi:hypothetical protein
MVRLLPLLLILAFTLYALIDCLARDEDEIRALPKVIWVLIILLFMPLGPVAWFIAGRPRGTVRLGRRPDDDPEDVVGGYSMGTGNTSSRGGRPLAPDDDPDFLRRLGEQQRRRDETEER